MRRVGGAANVLEWRLAAGLLLITAATTARGTPALGRELRDRRWQPPATILAMHAFSDQFEDVQAADPGEDGAVPKRTFMRCLGTTALTRACHFENVYYNISGNRFVYFGPEGATPDLFGQGVPGEPWLRLIRCVTVVSPRGA